MSEQRAVLVAMFLAMSVLPLASDGAEQEGHSQESRPQVTSKTNHQMSGGVVDGPLELTESLHVNGPLVVDGEAGQGESEATSEGNAAAEVPGKRKAEVSAPPMLQEPLGQHLRRANLKVEVCHQ